MFRICFLVVLLFVACSDTDKINSVENDGIEENKATQEIKPTDINDTFENNETSPLQKELKKNLKKHLDNLSMELQKQNIDDIDIDSTISNHSEYFNNLKSPKIDGNLNVEDRVNEAYAKQYGVLNKLQENNREIMK